MQGAVAGSMDREAHGASWLCHGGVAPQGSLGCWQLSLGLWQAHPFMDVLCASWQGMRRVLPYALYITGLSPVVSGQRQHGLTVRAHHSSQAGCPTLSLPPTSMLCLVLSPLLPWSGRQAGWGGRCQRWARAARLWCASLCKHQQRALGLRFSVTAHPMSELLQILPANSYANYLISCLIYFLWHHVFSTSPGPGGCRSPGLGGGRSSSGTCTQGWLC